MNKKWFICLSLLLGSNHLPPLYAIDSSFENYEDKQVAEITIKVENLAEASSFDAQTMRSKLKTQAGTPFSQYIFDQDLKTLAEENDRVEPSIEVRDGQIYVTLRIWLRPIIRSIQWMGNEKIKTKTLEKELDIKPGSLYSRTQFNKAFNKVKEYYIKKGYFESQLQYTLNPDPKSQEVDISITVNEGRAGKVDDIVFKGFTSDEESELLNMIYTKKYSLLTSWFTGMGTFNEEALEQDRLTIYNFLQDQGYADARVYIRINESPSKGKIILEIQADRGTLYHFGRITFNGNTLFTDEEVEKVFITRPEETYSPEKLRNTTQAIKDLYGRKGYIDASVTFETQLDENAPIYNVHFQIEEGQQYKIGLIRIIGNTQTQAYVILRESLLVPGETFDSLRLKITQARLENMGYFKSVNVYAVRTQDDLSLGENYRDVYIEVEETTTGSVSLFSGFSSADNIFGGLDITERNFNYRGITRVFKKGISAVRGGGEYLHLRASIGKKQNSYLGSWMTPYFLDTLWRFGFEVSVIPRSELLSENYDIGTYSFSVFASYPLSPYLTYGTKYRVRNIDIEVDMNSNKKEAHRLEHDSGILSGVGTYITYDSTDRASKPHNGYRTTLEGEFVGAGGDISFLRFGYTNAYYTNLWRYGYMKYHWDWRFIVPFWMTNTFEKIPLSERFFLGGVASVRGYKDFILGPRYKGTKGGHTKTLDNDPTGGISSSLLSVEYVQEVFKFLDAFAFIDAGFISKHRFSFGTYRMSYGVGVTIDVFGRLPVTLGLGFPVNAEKDTTRNFFFSMGGQF